jgi:hypothetical protein
MTVVQILLKILFFVDHEICRLSITKISTLMLFMEIIAVYSEHNAHYQQNFEGLVLNQVVYIATTIF